MAGGRIRIMLALAALALVAGTAVAAVHIGADGRIGPAVRMTGNGRLLRPPGTLVRLGHFPTGGALTPDNRFLWTISTGRAFNDIRIVAVGRPHVVQILPVPGASGGVAFDRTRALAYISGVADSTNKDEVRPGLPGRGGDVIHVFAYDRGTGRASETGVIAVPPPSGAPVPENFPPSPTTHTAWPDRLAVSPDGRRLLVPLNLADAAAIVDTATRRVRYVDTGPFPYGALVLPDNRTGLVSNEGPGTVSVVNLDTGKKVKDIQVATNLSHPEGMALNPRTGDVYVAIANRDQVAVIDPKSLSVSKVLSVERSQGPGENPVAVAVTPDGRRLYVAESAADELAVFSVPDGRLIGRIATAAYPADVQVTRARLMWIAGKGFGAGANPNGPNPLIASDDNLLLHPGTAVLSAGYAGVLPLPSDRQVRLYNLAANRQVLPVNLVTAPAGTPLRAGGPIRHVFYIVRENRTYDQVLGDDVRGDGDNQLTLFGRRITPNFHALVQRFPLIDHLYADSEASIDGHFWTSAGAVSDYVQKNWEQNYAGRKRPYDFGVYSITWPGRDFLFDRALQQNISFYNYGEAVAGTVPLDLGVKFGLTATDRDTTPADVQETAAKFARSDLGVGLPAGSCYPNDASIGTDAIADAMHVRRETFDSSLPAGANPATSESRFACFKQHFEQQLATGSVPAFNYLVLPSDHTQGLDPGARSPQSMVAENDYGLGQIIDEISHSNVWGSSAIFVVEDDSQDGADHVDAHRMPAAVISPFAKRGAIVHTRYDQLSVVHSIELILGMKPLGLMDAVATPMYDVFTSGAENAEPYDAVGPAYPLLERNPNTKANRDLARSNDFHRIDAAPQDVYDRVLWQAVHGAGSQPPPPGPNAEKGQ